MKKLALALATVMLLSLTPIYATNQEDLYNVAGVQTFENQMDYEDLFLYYIELPDGSKLLEKGELNYVKLMPNGDALPVESPYQIHGINTDGYLIIANEVSVPTYNEETSEAGEPIDVLKYGFMDLDFKVLIEPILDTYSSLDEPFLWFNSYGLAHGFYDAEYYYNVGEDDYWIPANSKTMLVSQNEYKTWMDYEEFNDMFITENRYVVKDEGISYLIDGDMNIITDKYTHIMELDDGKWYASVDTNETDPVYSVILDNNANVITGFDPNGRDEVSTWAQPYIEKGIELGIVSLGNVDQQFNTTYFKEEITRIEFCRLIVNFLVADNYTLPEDLNDDTFTDTMDYSVLIAYELGIIDGVGEGKFDPYANLTREQAAKILVDLADILVIATNEMSPESRYADIDEVSSWAKDSVLKISAIITEDDESVMGGTSMNTFSPKTTYTVEQAVTTLVRLVNTARG